MDRRIPAVVVLATAVVLSGCTEDPDGEDAAPPERISLDALATAETPKACEIPPGRMVDGSRVMGPDEDGDVILVQGADGDWWSLATTLSGQPDRLVRFDCNQGGVGWPEVIAVYGSDGKAIAGLDLSTAPYPGGDPYADGSGMSRAMVIGASRSADTVLLSWITYDGGSDPNTQYWDGTLSLRDGNLVLDGIEER